MAPKVSVIIPIYNVEGYLVRCLDSLVVQTLGDIQVLLIDDGSTDSSGTIAEEFAQKDRRFSVIHQENRGLSAARNTGIELAEADYLMFVDGDDWVEPDFCRIPFELALEHGVDMVMFRRWNDGFSHLKPISASLPEGPCTREEGMRLLFHGVGVAAWNKLYHRRLFQNVRYPVGRVYEDSGTTYRLVQAADRIWVSNALLYHYCYRKGSIITTLSRKNIQDRMEMFLQEAEDLRRLGYADLSEECVLTAGFGYLMYMGTRAEQAPRYLDLFRREKKALPDALWRKRAMLWLLRLSPGLFDLVCVLFKKRVKP